MEKKTVSNTVRLFFGLVLIQATFLASANEDYFTPTIKGSVVEFSPDLAFVRGTGVNFVVSGPNGYADESFFSPGQKIVWESKSGNSKTLVDGQYTYELTFVNSNRQRLFTPLDLEGKANDSVRQSGTLSVVSGLWVKSDVEETVFGRTQVIAEDLTVNGSICAGLDCTGSETFDFDTIRLKENNLRIRFVDTSNSASFPSTDWELRANETTNGGANKFSIADVDRNTDIFSVEAAAPANSLFVDSRGRVGFGTGTPLLDQHILSGNTPATRFQQDGSGGFPSQTWDIGGNETEFFIRDSSNASVPVRIQPGAPTGSLVVNSAGDIEIGGSIITNPAINLPNRALTSRGQSQLQDLATVEQHILRHQQLPGMDSRSEDLLQFQLKLLEKIQELTLYTIQQEKRIVELEAKSKTNK